MKIILNIFLLALVLNCNQKENDLKFIEDYINANNQDLSHTFLNTKNHNYSQILNFYTEREAFLETNNSKTNSYKWLFTKEELKQMQDFYSKKNYETLGR